MIATTTRLRHASALAAVLLAACGSTTLGDKLGVDVTARGSTITVAWDEQHVWGPLMAQRGADLVAEYPVASGNLVREVVSTTRGSNVRALSFTLPESMKGVAIGPVCLYVQLQANRNVLPVRKPRSPGEEAARFRYVEWEGAAVGRANERRMKAELAAVEGQLQLANRAVSDRQAALDLRGWASAADCERPQIAASVTPSSPPIGVLPLEQHEQEARRACVNRMQNTGRLRRIWLDRAVASKSVKDVGMLAEIAGSYAGATDWAAEAVQQVKGNDDPQVHAVLATRQRQAREYADDVKRLAPTLGNAYYPPVGKPDDRLELLGGAQAAHRKLFVAEASERMGAPAESRPTLSGNEVVILSGAMLDAYFGCVVESRKELKTKLDVWNELRREGPERQRLMREHFARECRADHAQLLQVSSEGRRLSVEAERLRSQLVQAPKGVGLPQKPVALNYLSCQ